MLNLNISKVNFDELDIKNITKRGILDTLKKFWNGNFDEYLEYLQSIGINYYEKIDNIYKLKQTLNNDIEKLKENVKDGKNVGKFNYQAISQFKNLQEVRDSEYYKLNIDLREVNDKNTITKIKDVFLSVDSCSLVDFKEINEERISLIYHKKGALIFFDNYIIANTRAENMSLIENYQVPKDNNFIVSKFLLFLATKLKTENINESFCYSYNNGKQRINNIKSIEEIIVWGRLKPEEKKLEKDKLKQQDENKEIAKEQAKVEIKQEINKNRDSLEKDSVERILQNSTSNVKLYNISSLSESDKNQKVENEIKNEKEEIENIIKNSFEVYHLKELEKTKERLKRAEKESYEAYKDLKDYLYNGTSILEAIRNIQQKYRNEDTINFASLLFSKDILNLKNKENEINTLKDEIEKSINYENELMDEITKREETISKLKGTLQSKINEITAMRDDFEKEIAEIKLVEEKLKEVEKISEEQEITIKELDNENDILSNENKKSKEELIRLKSENEYLNKQIEENKNRNLNNENLTKDYYKLQIDLEKEKIQNQYLLQSIADYKESEKEYKSKIEDLTSKLIANNDKTSDQEKKVEYTPRSKDILGKI
ncbi:hypothetical protein QTF06_001513 [Campylobacter jejuni]|uniref:Uncharacterized protein n=1 Tax=Campylobacter jejuni TaxID=197 RepID=A0AAN3U8H1_CAMJU|nr:MULTISPECIES: hypothetical protein [Campylobacter]EAL1140991.1 hypothetical protein [Campylobacter jejuni]EHB2512513.1 hypothetical protein [Campylobacter jejuni]EJP2870300.1 hypothetical protein [Campylobacter jejuni]ELH1635146.1 hypothetical protein [Campylobacter jejuni]ELQ2083957.1 hypothetical protein [Campylobacter jejuni]